MGGAGISWSGVSRYSNGSTAGGPPVSGGGDTIPAIPRLTSPTTRTWSAVMLPLTVTRAEMLLELTTIPPLDAVIPPGPRAASPLPAVGASRQRMQLLGASGPAAAAALA